MELSDAIIISEIKKGNKEVFHAVFEHYYPTLIKFAYSYIADKDVCQDMVQEVFVALWDQRQRLEVRSLKSYLMTAVKNKSLTHLRNLGIKDKHSVHVIEYFLNNETSEGVEDSEIALQVKEALKDLPAEMKKIFQLKYVHDLTMNEIAEDLDISVSTVKTQLSRARKKLRNQIAKRTNLLLLL